MSPHLKQKWANSKKLQRPDRPLCAHAPHSASWLGRVFQSDPPGMATRPNDFPKAIRQRWSDGCGCLAVPGSRPVAAKANELCAALGGGLIRYGGGSVKVLLRQNWIRVNL